MTPHYPHVPQRPQAVPMALCHPDAPLCCRLLAHAPHRHWHRPAAFLATPRRCPRGSASLGTAPGPTEQPWGAGAQFGVSPCHQQHRGPAFHHQTLLLEGAVGTAVAASYGASTPRNTSTSTVGSPGGREGKKLIIIKTEKNNKNKNHSELIPFLKRAAGQHSPEARGHPAIAHRGRR